ncbi:MAG: TIM barrel protein [bacterium]
MLHFGTGGVPLTAKKRDTLSGIDRIKELKLDSMEMEFVQGVKMSDESAKLVKKKAEENNVGLTIHGPYYINLATDDEVKLKNSYRHILSSIKVGTFAGAISATFHPAFVQKLSQEEVYSKVRDTLIYLSTEKKKNGYTTRISPELTGKESQFGRLEDLVRLCKEIPGLGLCYDFAHNYARSIGNNNTREEVKKSLELIKKELGQSFLDDMHIHMSNIEYSDKGERNHIPFLEKIGDYEKNGISEVIGNDEFFKKYFKEFYEGNKKKWSDRFDWKMIIEELKEYNVGGFVVCESPVLEWDAILLKNYYKSL